LRATAVSLFHVLQQMRPTLQNPGCHPGAALKLAVDAFARRADEHAELLPCVDGALSEPKSEASAHSRRGQPDRQRWQATDSSIRSAHPANPLAQQLDQF